MSTVPIFISDLRGGRNGIDSVIDPRFPFNQCAEAKNVDFFASPLGDKRGGASALSLTGGTAITGAVYSLIRHVPEGDEGDAELWLVDSAGLVKRLAGGTNWADVTLADAISADFGKVRGVSFNGKLFLFYNSAQDRTHVWDGSTVRRAGLVAASTAGTVADTGAGSYGATERFYRHRWLHVSGGLIVRRSEPSSSVAFTPSGAGSAARYTRATAPGEGETHWELEASTDDDIFYQVFGFEQGGTQIAIGTTTGDDSVTPANYSMRALSATLGTYSPGTSFKFAVTDGNRLIAAGTNEGGKSSRVMWTDILGSANKGDDERFPTRSDPVNYLDINEKDGGEITGMGGPVNGTIWLFKFRQIWRFTPTGDVDTPYLARKISDVVGAVSDRSIILAEDATGNPALYFWSTKGPHRLSVNGLEYLGRDIEDYIRGLRGKSQINLASAVPIHGRYYSDKSQVWWWVALGSDNVPSIKLKLDVKQAVGQDRFGVRGGWMVDDGPSAAAYSSEVFSNTVGADMSRDLKPYIGTATKILKCDTGDTSDDSTAFQSYVKTRSVTKADQLGARFGIKEGVLFGQGTAIVQVKLIKDFGKHEQTSNVTLTAVSPEVDDVIRKIGGAMTSDLGILQVQIGDAEATAQAWKLNAAMFNLDPQGKVSGG